MNETNIEMKRAFELRDELYDLANKFAREDKGNVAGQLHEACNCILRANNILNGQPAMDEMEIFSRKINMMMAAALLK